MSDDKIRDTISEILDDADLETITAKKVRQELQEKLGEDFTSRKKEIDAITLEILANKQNSKKSSNKRKRESEDEDEEGKEEEEEKPAKRTRQVAGKANAKKKGGKKRGTGFTRVCKLSPALSKVMGEESMARHEVVKRMWAIIKERNLYDPTNKQFAICDGDLLAVFGVRRFRTFGMMKHLKDHIYDQ